MPTAQLYAPDRFSLAMTSSAAAATSIDLRLKMPAYETDSQIDEHVRRLLERIDLLLRDRELLQHEHRERVQLYHALQKRQASPEVLTPEEQMLVKDKGPDAHAEMPSKVARDPLDIAREIRTLLVPDVWNLVAALQRSNFRKATLFQRELQVLLAEISDDKYDTGWTAGFLVDFGKLLQTIQYSPQERLMSHHCSPALPTLPSAIDETACGPRSIPAGPAAEKLDEWMKARGLRPQKLSERMNHKVSAKTISKLLKKRVATPSTLDDIAKIMNLTKESLLSKQ